MSQPPSPYSRSYSFTAWKVSNPNDPLPGNNVDQQLDNVATSLNATISRLNEIQRDDGKIDISSIISATDQFNAASAVYATNLSLLPDKAEARANLELNQYYPLLAGDNLFIESQSSTNPSSYLLRTFPNGVLQPGQSIYNPYTTTFPGPLSTSTYNSRKFRSSILFGTLKDSATVGSYTSSIPDISYRVDNVSMALLYGGTKGEKGIHGSDGQYEYYTKLRGAFGNTTLSTGESGVTKSAYNITADTYRIRYLLERENYSFINNFPSSDNPFVSFIQLNDAISTHETFFNHDNMPRNAEKLFLTNLLNKDTSSPFANSAVITNASGYTAGSFNTTYYPKEIKMVLNGITYAVPARIVT